MLDKMKKEKINLKEYIKYFSYNGPTSCIHAEFLINGTFRIADIMVISKGNKTEVLIKKEKEILCSEKGKILYTNPKKFKKYLTYYKKYIEFAKKRILKKYKEVPKHLDKNELFKDIKIIGKLWKLYGFGETFFQELAYKDKTPETQAALNKIGYFKFKARALMNKYFFKEGVINNILKYISKEYYNNQSTHYLYLGEIKDLINGKRPDLKKIHEREKCYCCRINNEKIQKVSYNITKTLCDKLFATEKDAQNISGVIAFPGKSKGRVIIASMLNDRTTINQINKKMKQGDILIAETTSPDILMLCKKAAAIVTEQGGMLSHVAIVSRELKIPCLIQANKSTKIFNDRDMVEVDCFEGIVKKI